MLQLGEHFQSSVGQECTKLPMDEDIRKRQKLPLNVNDSKDVHINKPSKEEVGGSPSNISGNIAALTPHDRRYSRNVYAACKTCK